MFNKLVLKPGLKVVSEKHTDSKAVSLGIWVPTGTRDEPRKHMGISHFIEHLVFKGTRARTAYQIAKSLEQYGGDLNAFTTREYTCYHALVLKKHWKEALDVLTDLVTGMALSKSNFELEKSVILQEIGMSDENLEELIYDVFLEKLYPDNPLGFSILGTKESIEPLAMKDVLKRYRNYYAPSQLIVSVAGDVNFEEITAEIKKRTSRVKLQKKSYNKRVMPKAHFFRECQNKKSEQLHLLMGFPVPSFKDTQRFEAFILNALLGGGMTSRLYQDIRERKGLVYSIGSSLNTFTDCGMINVYAACDLANMKKVLASLSNGIRAIAKKKITEREIEMFKTQVIGQILLGSDDLENRMQSIAINEMIFSEYRSVESVTQEIEAVSLKSVKKFIDEYLDADRTSIILMGENAESLKTEIKNWSW